MLGYRLFLTFISERHGVSAPQYIERLRVPRSGGIDLYVPGGDEVSESIRYLQGLADRFRRHDYLQLYILLLASGCRVTEAEMLLSRLDRGQADGWGRGAALPPGVTAGPQVLLHIHARVA